MGGGITDRNMYTMKKALQEEYDEDGQSDTLSNAAGYPVQAHHLICCSVMQQLEGGKMARLAEASGYDINNGNNGIALPAKFGHQRKEMLARHRGGHWEKYYKNVRTELAKIYKRHKNDKPCGDDPASENIKGDLEDLEDLIRGKLTKRQWWLYDWSEKLWKGDYRDEGIQHMNSSRVPETSYSAGLQWLVNYAGPQVKRRHKMVDDEPVVRDDWYNHYTYPVPGSPTS
jgi:hypothetical protein